MTKVIDFHTHIFPDNVAEKTIPFLEKRSGIHANTDGTVKGLLDSMEMNGTCLSVVLPVVTNPSQFKSINTFAKYINDTYHDKLLSFGGIHPDNEDYKECLDRIHSLGLTGIKLHPDYQGVYIDDDRYMRIIEYADKLGMIIVTHAGIDIGIPEPVRCSPDRLRRVLDVLHPQKFVAAHLGGWKQWDMVYDLLAGEDVYLDTAFTADYISKEMFLKIWNRHSKDKILFATDSPWSSVEKGIEFINTLPVSPADRNNILSGNAKKLLGIT